MLLATGSFFLVRSLTDQAAFLSWGWRLPFLASAVLVVVGLVVRLQLAEGPEFAALRARGGVAKLPVLEALRGSPRSVVLTTGLRISQIALFVLVTTYGLTYISQRLGADSSAGLLAVVVTSALGLATTPLWAALSDRIGRRKPSLFGAFAGLVGLALFFGAVQTGSTVLIVLAAVVALNVAHDAMYGPQAAWFAELFDARVRYSGASLGYQIGSVLGGGFSPLVAAALVALTGGPWAVVAYLGVLTALTAVSAGLARETAFDPGPADAPITPTGDAAVDSRV